VLVTYLDIVFQAGITIAARKYDLSSPTPFQTSDVFDLRPVVKHSVPSCSEAKELVETGKLQLAEVFTILHIFFLVFIFYFFNTENGIINTPSVWK